MALSDEERLYLTGMGPNQGEHIQPGPRLSPSAGIPGIFASESSQRVSPLDPLGPIDPLGPLSPLHRGKVSKKGSPKKSKGSPKGSPKKSKSSPKGSQGTRKGSPKDSPEGKVYVVPAKKQQKGSPLP